MKEEIEQQINNEDRPRKVELKGTMSWTETAGKSFTIGKNCMKGIISVTRPNVVVDGSDGEIMIDINDCDDSDKCLFYIHPSARNVTFQNLSVKVNIKNRENTTRVVSVFYNTAFGAKFINCHLEVIADKQVNIIGIYNNGNLDTHMETRADNLVISDCFIKAECVSERIQNECVVYGLYNNLANSISVQNNFIYVINKGNGSNQKAIGVYTNGRFGRFVGNNIKANGTHNIGKLKEAAHVTGFLNDGLYTIFTSNNIIGEWAGKCVGLETNGEFAMVNSNKILATHTICGRSIINRGNKSNIEANVLTSTSRNARLLELDAENCIINENIMEVLMAPEECRSGCGIYAVSDHATGNIIIDNIILNTSDCGIITRNDGGTVKDNKIAAYPYTVLVTTSDNYRILSKLDESNIVSIYS